MWNSTDISSFFSIFGVKPREFVSSHELTRNDLDGFSEEDFRNLSEIDECTARVMHTLWNQICSFRHCAQDALDQVKETLVSEIDD
jgi:hypothetical protein